DGADQLGLAAGDAAILHHAEAARLEEMLLQHGRSEGEGVESPLDALEAASGGGLAGDFDEVALAQVRGGLAEGPLGGGLVFGMAHRGEGGKNDPGVPKQGMDAPVADRIGPLPMEPGVKVPRDDAQEHELEEIDVPVARDEPVQEVAEAPVFAGAEM